MTKTDAERAKAYRERQRQAEAHGEAEAAGKLIDPAEIVREKAGFPLALAAREVKIGHVRFDGEIVRGPVSRMPEKVEVWIKKAGGWLWYPWTPARGIPQEEKDRRKALRERRQQVAAENNVAIGWVDEYGDVMPGAKTLSDEQVRLRKEYEKAAQR